MDMLNQDIIEYGAAAITLRGETESGDSYVISPFTNGILIAVIDGLGHGSEAALAGRLAAEIIKVYSEESVVSLMQRCHARLQSSRGAVMSIASISKYENTLTFLSVGNIESYFIDAESRSKRFLLQRSGLIGFSLPLLRPHLISLRRGDMLVQATDGIQSGFDPGYSTETPVQMIADSVVNGFAKGNDDALALVVRYRGLFHD